MRCEGCGGWRRRPGCSGGVGVRAVEAAVAGAAAVEQAVEAVAEVAVVASGVG